ncbi:MAG TPA: hypothetical protein VE503_03270 [Ornithinibacter sp.]|jgi:hypothetical protein|nr:hypothetical protein [Ornithinibacter sp.]
MRRITLATLIALLFAAFTATSAQAATIVDFSNAPSGAHFAQGASAPVCTYTGATTVSCTGTAIQGVGNTNAVVRLDVTATFTGVCQNPGSKSKVVDPFTEAETTTSTATLTPSRNGRLDVGPRSATATTSGEFLADFTCPNPRWEADVTGTSISFRYTLTFAGEDDPAILITG